MKGYMKWILFLLLTTNMVAQHSRLLYSTYQSEIEQFDDISGISVAYYDQTFHGAIISGWDAEGYLKDYFYRYEAEMGVRYFIGQTLVREDTTGVVNGEDGGGPPQLLYGEKWETITGTVESYTLKRKYDLQILLQTHMPVGGYEYQFPVTIGFTENGLRAERTVNVVVSGGYQETVIPMPVTIPSFGHIFQVDVSCDEYQVVGGGW